MRCKKGQIEAIFNMGFVCHHLIRFTREALRGEHNASFYAAKAAQAETDNPTLRRLASGETLKRSA